MAWRARCDSSPGFLIDTLVLRKTPIQTVNFASTCIILQTSSCYPNCKQSCATSSLELTMVSAVVSASHTKAQARIRGTKKMLNNRHILSSSSIQPTVLLTGLSRICLYRTHFV